MSAAVRLAVLLVSVVFFLGATCSRDPWSGTYANANGSLTLDVQRGGKAAFTFLGGRVECTYTTDRDRTMSLDCPEPAGDVTFDRQSDESIVARGMPMIGRLTKSRR
jgi:hypothetical protein